MSDSWYYASHGNTLGPVSFDGLQQLAASGQLLPTDQVSSDGATWSPANAISGLSFPETFAPSETLSYPAPGLSNPTVTNRSVEFLRQTATWVRIMSVLMWIGIGFTIVASLIAIIAGIVTMGRHAEPNLIVVGIAYLAGAALYAVPAIFLTRYATHAKAFARDRHELSLENALQAQKSFWKYVAVFSLVVLGLYCLFAIMAVAAISMFSAFRHP